MTLGSPLVSPEFAGCPVPADRCQHMVGQHGEGKPRQKRKPGIRAGESQICIEMNAGS